MPDILALTDEHELKIRRQPKQGYKETALRRRVKGRVLSDFAAFKEALRDKHRKFIDYYEHYYNIKQKERKRGQANVPVPLATETIDTVHADVMDKIVSTDGLLIDVAPGETTDEQQTQASKDMIHYQIYVNDMISSISKMVHTLLVCGTAAGKVSYIERYESYTRTEDITDLYGIKIGERKIRDERLVYKGPSLEPVDIFDFFPHPAIVDILDDLPIIHRFQATPEHLKEMQRKGIYENVDFIDWDADVEVGTSHMEDQEKLQRRKLAGVEDSHVTRKAVECYEWQGLYDLDETGERVNAVLVVTEDGIVLRAEELPYDSKEKTWITPAIFRIQGEFWGIGLVEKQHAMIHGVNSLNNTVLDALYQAVYPPTLIDDQGIPDESELVSRKGQIIHIRRRPGESLQEYYMRMPPERVAPDAWQMMGNYMDWAGRSSGVADFMKGHMPTKRQTATAIQTTFSQASVKFKFILQMIEQTLLIPLCRKMQQINLQFIDRDYVIRVVGIGGVHWRTISPAEIAGDVHFVALGSSREMDKGVNIQQLLQALQIAGGNPMLQQLVPILFLALTDQFKLPHRGMIQNMLNWEQTKNQYYEQLRMQIAQAQMQQGVMPQLPPAAGEQTHGIPKSVDQDQLLASMNMRNRTFMGGAA